MMIRVANNRIAEEARSGAEAAKEIHTVAAMLLSSMRDAIGETEIARLELAAGLAVLEQLVGALRELRAGAEGLAAAVEREEAAKAA